MKFWVGVIDNKGFEFLAEQRPDEVNFWQPSGTRSFQAIEPGAPFLFKLHSPQNSIVGGGLFHGLHRFKYILYDVGLHKVKKVLDPIMYGLAAAGTVAALLLAFSFP